MRPSRSGYLPVILRCRPERSGLASDLFAGLLVGIIALPLAIAFAIASGAPPIAGMTTGVVAGLAIALFGGSRFQIGGPTGAFVGLCAVTVAQQGLAGLALATVMAGILLIALGLLRLGHIVRLIPAPVVIGFTSGIAVVIASTQLRDALGLGLWPEAAPSHFHERLQAVAAGLATWKPWALGLCLLTVAVTLVMRRYASRWPGALLAIILAALLAGLGGLPVERIGDRFPDLPRGFPLPSLDAFAGLDIHGLADLLRRLGDLSGTALAICLLAAIESLLSATVADSMGKDQHDSDSELIGQGIANILVPFVGGLPATGAIARTATNIRAGARSPLAGAIHAITLLTIMLVATPLVAWLPMAALAGVLFVVAWQMSELHHWPHILRGGRSDAFLLITTFLLTVFLDLTVAVEVGVLLGMFFFIRRMSNAYRIRVWTDSESAIGLPAIEDLPPEIEVFEIDGPFFFGMASHLRNLLAGLDGRHRVLIIRMRHVPFVDASAAAALRSVIADCARQQRHLLLSGVGAQCRADLQRHGVVALVGAERIKSDIDQAIALAKSLLTTSA